tara:strand:- start:2544 stop:2774 length:231 start_codon:yes stop_codon:yes gene_type:complete
MVKGENMNLSNQALGAIMLALQESLLNELDIVPILKGFELEESENGDLVVKNPPTVRFTDNSTITEEDLTKLARDA